MAVWSSMYNTSFLAIGFYLHASGHYEDYEPLLSWAQALNVSSPGARCVVLGDLIRNPGWVTEFPRVPPAILELFDQLVLDSSLTRAEFINTSPKWVASQGWSNVLDYILLRVPISRPWAFMHSSSPFLSNHFAFSPSLPLRISKQERKLWETKRRHIFMRNYPRQCVNVSTCALLSISHLTGRSTQPRKLFISFTAAYCKHRNTIFGHPGSISSTPSVFITPPVL